MKLLHDIIESQGFLAILLGTAGGYLAGFILRLFGQYVFAKAYSEPRELKRKIKSRQRLKTALIDSLNRNISLCGQMSSQLGNPSLLDLRIPSYNVDLDVLTETAASKYELMNDDKVCQALDVARFELSHLTRRIDFLMLLIPTGQQSVLLSIVHGVIQVVQSADKECKAAMAELNNYDPTKDE
ncbi:hypothetical protein K2X85_16205 [bacterium]|nr:hypothetical protein [bacterium]